MKNIKRLFVLFAVCCLFSTFGVNAIHQEMIEPHSTLDNYLSFNVSTPPYNGSVTTPWRTKKNRAVYQTITNVKTNPTYDSLDVRLKYDKNGNTNGTQVGAWEQLINGGHVTFDSVEAVILGYYQLYIDSRIHYTGYTQASGYWNLN